MQYVVVALVVVASVVVLVAMRSKLEGGGGSAGRKLAALRVSRIADGDPTAESTESDSLVRFEGRAIPVGDPLLAPGSGLECVAHDTWISAFDGSGSPSRRSFQEAVDLVVEDDTGRALVRVDGLRLAVERDRELPEATLDELAWADAALRSQGVSLGNPTMQRVTVHEGLIPPGARVSVAGVAHAPDQAADAAGAVLVLRAHPRSGLLLAPADAPATT